MDAETKRAIEALEDTLIRCKAVADAFSGQYIDTDDINATAALIRANPEEYIALYNVMESLLYEAYTTAKQLAS